MSNRLANKFVADLSIEIGFDTQNHMNKLLTILISKPVSILKTLEQIVTELSCDIDVQAQNHIKKGVLWKQ